MNSDPALALPSVPSAPLAAITQAIAASLDVSQIFSIVAAQTGKILAHDALAVLLWTEPDAAERELVVAFCSPPALAAGHP